MADRSHIWNVIKGCIGSNNKLNLQLKRFNKTTDGRGAYFAIEAFLLGNDHASSLISATEKGMRGTTFTTNLRNWRIEDYITKNIELYSVIDDQKALGIHQGMFENRRVDLLLDGLKNKALGGLKSNIMCHPQLYNDFNATATHLKDMVNCMPELQTAPGRQVYAMGRGGGRSRGTGRGGRDSRSGRDRRGGRRFDSGRGHGGRGNDCGRRGDRIPSSTTFRPENCPEQDDVDHVKPNIVHRHVTGNRIFIDDNTYKNQMNTT